MFVPRTFWEEQNQHCKDAGRYDLDPKTDTPLLRACGRKARVCSVGDPRRYQRADSEHELLQRCDTASDIWVTELCLVRRNDHNQESNADSSKSYNCELPTKIDQRNITDLDQHKDSSTPERLFEDRLLG